MPKYTPDSNDLYNTKPCCICGRDVLEDDKNTCSEICEQQKTIFEEDFEWFLSRDYEEEDDWY